MAHNEATANGHRHKSFRPSYRRYLARLLTLSVDIELCFLSPLVLTSDRNFGKLTSSQ